MVKGVDSCIRGPGFECHHPILDGHTSCYFVVENCNVCLKKTKNKQKGGRGWPI